MYENNGIIIPLMGLSFHVINQYSPCPSLHAPRSLCATVVRTHRGHSRGELRVLVLHQRLHRGGQEDGCPGDDPATRWLVGAGGWGNGKI